MENQKLSIHSEFRVENIFFSYQDCKLVIIMNEREII